VVVNFGELIQLLSSLSCNCWTIGGWVFVCTFMC